VQTQRARPLQFSGRLPGGGLLNLPVHDISVTGVGLSGANLPDGLAVGMVLPNCHFSLPEDEHELFFSATLRHLSEREGRGGVGLWQLGLQFNDLPTAAQNRIQRYIDKVERERHELA
jgi:c-di-GMP-binding flagellar brake protein YcgR